MIIRFSRYNSPFFELPEQGVHYIPLDYQADIRLGRLDAHVKLYKSLKASVSLPSFVGRPFASIPLSPSKPAVMSKEELKFIDELYYDCGIKAAGKRAKRWM